MVGKCILSWQSNFNRFDPESFLPSDMTPKFYSWERTAPLTLEQHRIIHSFIWCVLCHVPVWWLVSICISDPISTFSTLPVSLELTCRIGFQLDLGNWRHQQEIGDRLANLLPWLSLSRVAVGWLLKRQHFRAPSMHLIIWKMLTLCTFSISKKKLKVVCLHVPRIALYLNCPALELNQILLS